MPFGIKKSGDQFVIYRRDTGKIKSHHASKKKAQAAMRAIYANSPEAVNEAEIRPRRR
jgi:hypothetical protein